MNEPTKGESQIPVLTRKRPGGYRNDLFLGADYKLEESGVPNVCRIVINLSLERCYLRTLIESGKADVCLNLSQRSFRTSYQLKLDETNTIDVNTKDLMSGAKVDLLPIIVAREDLELPFVEGEMLSRYQYLNPPFIAKKGFILGYGEGKTFPLSGSSNVSSFFSVSRLEDDVETKAPFILDLSSEQIIIKMRSGEYEQWEKAMSSPSLINDFALLNASIGFPAIYQTILAIFDKSERNLYRKRSWYGALVELLRKKLNQDDDVFLTSSSAKDMREKAWQYTGIVLDGLMGQSFTELLHKGRANR